MSIEVRSGVLALLLTGALAGGRLLAQNEGLEDLDRATEVKITGRTLNDLGEVIRLCERALEKGLDDENTRFAKELLASTRILRGTRVAQTILGSTPSDPMWPQYRRFALEDLEQGVALDPRQPHALYRIGQLNALPGGDPKRATEALTQAIDAAEDEPSLRANALVLRATLQQEMVAKLADLDEAVRTNPRDAAALRVRGATYAQQKQYEQALADFEAAVQLDPDHVLTHVEQANVLTELKRYDEAIPSLDKAHQLAPKSVLPLILQARIRGLQSNFEKALELLEEAYRLEPGDLRVLLLRAAVYQELGEEQKAVADVDRVLQLSPKLPEAMRLRARLLARSGKFDLAMEQLEKLLEINPEDLETELHLALYYSVEGQSQKAIDGFSAVLEQQPDNAVALRGRADALLSLGKQAEAIEDYEKALKLEPEDTGVLNNLAWVLATSPDEKLRHGKRAIELATKACELTEYKQAHILSTLGAGYAETGDFETAIKWSRKAIEIAGEEHLEALKKELESYQAGKPVRELMTGPEPEKQAPPPPDEKQPAPAKEAAPPPADEKQPALPKDAAPPPPPPSESDSAPPKPPAPEAVPPSEGPSDKG